LFQKTVRNKLISDDIPRAGPLSEKLRHYFLALSGRLGCQKYERIASKKILEMFAETNFASKD
jgi:hypothetical protein